MNGGLFSGVSPATRVVFLGMTMGAIAVPMLLVMILARPEPIARNSVLGCYTASHAPSLDVREDAIHIVEPARRTLSYVAEASKTSYQLNVRPALRLTPQSDGRYVFVQTHGIGYFWPLLPAAGKNRNRVRHPDEYAGQFEVAADGQRVVYTRVSVSGACH